MKKVIKKKLELNKSTVSSLNEQQLSQINGGWTITCHPTPPNTRDQCPHDSGSNNTTPPYLSYTCFPKAFDEEIA